MKHADKKIDEAAKRRYELKQARPALLASLVGKTPAQMAAAVNADIDAKQAAKPGGSVGANASANRVAALEELVAMQWQMIAELIEKAE